MTGNLLQIKQRFGIIGNSDKLHRAIDVAVQVAPTDLSVLITGESGTGKETFPKIIHQFGLRKHGQYIPVNCGAIPEGTIDSELFGHEKGSFTGAVETRKGYFEVADQGTIFLDEVAELPLSTQVRLLRVLETGEFYKVGSSKVQKTDVRVVAATNVDIPKAIRDGKFREDLFYRLNTVPIIVPALRERKDDIHLLFRKFANDFAEKYRMPSIVLDQDAISILSNYLWPGNVRQLKNITEQISVIEQKRNISSEVLKGYLPGNHFSYVPAVIDKKLDQETFNNERELLYKILFDMKKEVTELKKMVYDIIQDEKVSVKNNTTDEIAFKMKKMYQDDYSSVIKDNNSFSQNEIIKAEPTSIHNIQDTIAYEEESLSIGEKEFELIKKALEKHSGKRKNAAKELGISERTLYRKLKEYNLE